MGFGCVVDLSPLWCSTLVARWWGGIAGVASVTKRNAEAHNGFQMMLVASMPVIRFVREGRDVECYPGENLRDVALREGIELYGLKGRLGNCNGCGQCITCFVDVVAEAGGSALSPRTSVEDVKLKRRPEQWRLACQSLVQQSVVVLTKPQTGLSDRDGKIAAAKAATLPVGPTSWPVVEAAGDTEEEAGDPGSGGVEVPPMPSVLEGEAATPDDEP